MIDIATFMLAFYDTSIAAQRVDLSPTQNIGAFKTDFIDWLRLSITEGDDVYTSAGASRSENRAPCETILPESKHGKCDKNRVILIFGL